jgi:hypothetical protein
MTYLQQHFISPSCGAETACTHAVWDGVNKAGICTKWVVHIRCFLMAIWRPVQLPLPVPKGDVLLKPFHFPLPQPQTSWHIEFILWRFWLGWNIHRSIILLVGSSALWAYAVVVSLHMCWRLLNIFSIGQHCLLLGSAVIRKRSTRRSRTRNNDTHLHFCKRPFPLQKRPRRCQMKIWGCMQWLVIKNMWRYVNVMTEAPRTYGVLAIDPYILAQPLGGRC